MPAAQKIIKQVWTPPGRRTIYSGNPESPDRITIPDSELNCEWFDWSINPMLVRWDDGTWSIMSETAVRILALDFELTLKKRLAA